MTAVKLRFLSHAASPTAAAASEIYELQAVRLSVCAARDRDFKGCDCNESSTCASFVFGFSGVSAESAAKRESLLL